MAAVDAVAPAQGYVTTSQAAIYTNSSGSTVIIPENGLEFINANAATQTLLIYLNRDGTARLLARAVLEQFWRYVHDAKIVLLNGDIIEAVTTTSSAVSFQVSGGEEQ